MTLETGAMLGRYRIESLVGRGGMGAVYLATDTELDRRVALKILAPELSDDERFRVRFIAESRIAASLDHTNIVPVYEAGEIDGRLFIAMRYIDGHDLSDVLAERGALPIPLAVRIVGAIAGALDAAHARGLVHRDVKPGNVLLAGPDETPLVYLTDFGLTKRIGDQSMTAAGQIVGSIAYVAPEQVEGRPVDARTDVYSLGCLAFEILTGTPPFQRDSEMAILMAHVQDPPPSLLARRPELPEALDAAVAKAMAKDPAARFTSAGEFAAAVLEAVRPDSGAITRGFLFADLRGYTAYVETHGDSAASALLLVYRRMMRDTIARHGGAEIKTEGDSFYVVFPSASGAVMCGLSIVAAAAAQSHADPQNPIRVGIGVNAGEAVAAPEGYVGSAVNIAARVCALAKPGEVWVTDTVRGLTRTSGRLIFTSVGRHSLKGIAEPMALYRAEPGESVTAVAVGGRGPIWRRPLMLVGGGGGLLLGVLAALALSGRLPGDPSASASSSAPIAQPVDLIAYAEAEASALDPSIRSAKMCSPGRALYAYVADVRLALIDPSGGDPAYITEAGEELEVHPAWSPDGTRIAFIGWTSEGGRSNVYVRDFASEQTTNVASLAPDEATGPAARIAGVSWSPDGTKLLFGWGPNVWVVSADKNDARPLPITMPNDPESTPDPVYPSILPDPIPVAPTWLADGSIAALVDDQIALQTDERRRGGRTLAVVPAGGGVLTPVPWLEGMRVESAAWSPDRTRVAFVAADVADLLPTESRIPDLYVANADGSDRHVIESAHGFAADPAWSPDGTQLVFGFGPLHVVDADGGEVRELAVTADRAACWAAWGHTTTAALPLPTPTAAPGETQAPLTFKKGTLDPGTYLGGTFHPSMQFTLGPGWEGVTAAEDTVRMRPVGSLVEFDILNVQFLLESPGCLDSPTRPVGEPLDLVTYLQEHPYLTVGEAVPYSVADRSGQAVMVSESRPLAAEDCPGQIERHVHLITTAGQDLYRIGEENQVWFVAVQVGGDLIVFSIEAPADRLVEFRAQAQVVLDSLTFP